MRSKANGLHHPADRAGVHQLDRARDRADLEPLGVVDRPDTAGLGDSAAQVCQLLDGGAAGLVAHHVLAVPHGLDGDRGAIAVDRGCEDQLDRRVLQQPAFVGDARDMRVARDEAGERLRLALRPVAGALAALVEQTAGHFVDMPMIQSDGSEPERACGVCGHIGSSVAGRPGLPQAARLVCRARRLHPYTSSFRVRLRKVIDQRVTAIAAMLCSHLCRASPLRW